MINISPNLQNENKVTKYKSKITMLFVVKQWFIGCLDVLFFELIKKPLIEVY